MSLITKLASPITILRLPIQVIASLQRSHIDTLEHLLNQSRAALLELDHIESAELLLIYKELKKHGFKASNQSKKNHRT